MLYEVLDMMKSMLDENNDYNELNRIDDDNRYHIYKPVEQIRIDFYD
jgi:hypothetical protein